MKIKNKLSEYGNIFPGDLKNFCLKIMSLEGMNQHDAEITAEVLVTTDMMGIHTHGVKQLRGLMKNYRDNRMDIHARPLIVSEGPAWVQYDGCHCMPMVSSVSAINKIIQKAKSSGIAIATIKNSGHFGAAGYYANLAAKEKLIGLSMTNVDPAVAVTGSKASVLGTNPIAYAIPNGSNRPILFDAATSVVAASKVYMLKNLGKEIPPGWLLDKDGIATTDPSKYPDEGTLMPMAGYKGYGLGLLVEILTGSLSGGAMGSELTCWLLPSAVQVNQSHTFMVINPEVFSPYNEFIRKIKRLEDQIRNAPRAKDVERIYLPGEKEWEYYEDTLKHGISLPDHMTSSIFGVADDYGITIEEYFGK
ncbi:MAG: Ldh family oxidoreductase [Treponema sp.]|jgi:ureidoglycolate dehydrogenase (NAD+)|nr:Ldh family oxidoreductase [Treponema sp.]